MKPKRIKTERPNKGDCWNVALSIATGIPYDQIRKRFKDNIEKGGLSELYFRGILREHGFRKPFEAERKVMNIELNVSTFRDMIEQNNKNEEMLLVSKNHAVFIKGNEYHDSFSSLKHIVVCVFMKNKTLNQLGIEI